MKPRDLMIIGTIGFCAAILRYALDGGDGSTVIFLFASGCVFGKGYGVWEARQALKGGGE